MVDGFVLLAAGRSSRFEGSVRKQFAELAGRSVLRHALNRMPEVGTGIVVAPPDDPESVREHLSSGDFRSSYDVTPGGETRRKSVRLGLESLRSAGIDRVLVHDAARPLMPTAVHRRVLDTLSDTVEGAVPVLPVDDTIKRVKPSKRAGEYMVDETLDRDCLRRIQTPQAFRYDLLYSIHQNWGNEPVTDDAMMVESKGHPVGTTPGSVLGRKITRETDRVILEELFDHDRS